MPKKPKLSLIAQEFIKLTRFNDYVISKTQDNITFIGCRLSPHNAKIDFNYGQEYVVSLLGLDGEIRIGCTDNPLEAIVMALKAVQGAVLNDAIQAITAPPDIEE